MIRELIKEYIGQSNILSIDYCNLHNDVNVRYIRYINYSDEFGKEYISAYNMDSNSYLTFKIERIKSIMPVWTEIYDLRNEVKESGLFLFACEGDNHIYFELHKMQKSECIGKYFIGDFEHMSGWFTVTPMAFYRIDNAISDYQCPSNENISTIRDLLGTLNKSFVYVIKYIDGSGDNYVLINNPTSGIFDETILDLSIMDNSIALFKIPRYNEIDHHFHLENISRLKCGQI